MTHIVREPECFQISGLCNMQRRRLEADGKFPRRFKLNPDGGPFGACGWDFDELMSWCAERRNSREPVTAPETEPLTDAEQSAAA
jgi:predicted DNA-binding transcriptional regulator AlpA